MTKNYKGALTLDWYRKQESIILTRESSGIPAPVVNWVNKDEALFYLIDSSENRGVTPFWVDRQDIRVREARPLKLKKLVRANAKEDSQGNTKLVIQESEQDDPAVSNMLIKGDNLLALNSIAKLLEDVPDADKVRCIFIDPPYNTGSAFKQYDDNLEHSEWLTLMRDRLVVLRELLSSDGSIWITIDDKEAHYLKVLCDDIFGKENFVANVIWEKVYSPRMDAEEFSVSHDHILVYSKSEAFRVRKLAAVQNEKQFTQFDPVKKKYYRPRTLRKEGSESLRTDRKDMYYPLIAPDGTEVYPIRPDGQEGRWRWGRESYNERQHDDIIWKKNDEGKWEVIVKQWKEDNPVKPPSTYWSLHEVVDTSTMQAMLWEWLEEQGKLDKLLKQFSAEVHDDTIFRSHEVGHNHGAKEEVKALNVRDVFATPKPEKLLQRVLEIATDEGDLVLDCFGGSGTTFAVAQKMGRRWIGVEIGNHAETHIIPRLTKVISGLDKGGITNDVSYSGGGAFKYYELGESIIRMVDGQGDFNWPLGADFIQEALLHSYNYHPVKLQALGQARLYDDKLAPAVGIQQLNNTTRAAVFMLHEPNGKMPMIEYDEVFELYSRIKAQFDCRYVNIFTNRGVDLASDSKPEDLEIFKVPHAIFAELE
jgi:adenine-specific DNA-methyltransferase